MLEHLLARRCSASLPDYATRTARRCLVTSRGAAGVGAVSTSGRCRRWMQADGVALFAERARSLDPSFTSTAEVDRLCAGLDNLPLALELAAARTSLFTPAQLLDRLAQRLDLAQGRTRGGASPRDVARDDLLVVRAARRGRAATLPPPPAFPAGCSRGRGEGVRGRAGHVPVPDRQESRPPPRHGRRAAVLDARDNPRVRGENCCERMRRGGVDEGSRPINAAVDFVVAAEPRLENG